ncbi:MAG: fasciclin domain-containing protein, partial [Bacteroidales bacterium]|nr:fasciclin domain-containing protein [Bacteroidales bacterium]
VVAGNVRSNQLSSGAVETLNGNINVEIGNSVTINGTSKVVLSDVQGTNGVIHVIDEVLVPSGK